MSDFLFELGVEEVPVSEIPNIINQLKSKFEAGLNDVPVRFKNIETAATNKRFMIYINHIEPKADDIEEQVKGPSMKAAYDENNEPTVALRKFMESKNLDTDDLIEMKTPKGLYVGYEKKVEGQKTSAILVELIPSILKELTFSKTMLWNASRTPFVRPIKTLLALFDNRVIAFEFAGIKSSNQTTGHILLSDKPIKVSSFRDYCELLSKNFVLVNQAERKKKIIDEIVDVEEDLSVRVRPDDKMLEYYIYNNEYPVLFAGKFASKYLELPPEIISTFMINEKKLLPVYDKEDKLVNHFIGVSNIPDENQNVVHGNERVIQATFEDAKFFWDNDRQDDFLALRENLKNVMFHEGLGNFYEKTDRLVNLVKFLAETIGQGEAVEALENAALLCKNDLVTRMVREFPSLQGIMGGLYLKETGAEENLSEAVYWHYEPKGFSKTKLSSIVGGILSIADKIDNICGFIYKGIRVSSSKDPYGVRRDANAIIKAIKDLKLDFDLVPLIQMAVERFDRDYERKSDKSLDKTVADIKHFFISRIENTFKDNLNFRYDIVNAILQDAETIPIYRLYLKAYEVSVMMETDSIQHLISLHKRLKNIVKDAKPGEVDEEILAEEEEKILYEIYKESRDRIDSLVTEQNYSSACSTILEMKPVIDNFFEKVLVMAEDPQVKENRIALLYKLDRLLSKIADFSLVVE